LYGLSSAHIVEIERQWQLYLLWDKTLSSLANVTFRPSAKRLRWSRGSVLAFGTQVRGFAPGRSRRIFRAKKNPQHAFLRRRGSKAVGSPCRSFTACKRSLNVTCKSPFRQHFPDIFSPTVLPSAVGRCRVVTRVETPGGESWNV
jgi:hypothetical protein